MRGLVAGCWQLDHLSMAVCRISVVDHHEMVMRCNVREHDSEAESLAKDHREFEPGQTAFELGLAEHNSSLQDRPKRPEIAQTNLTKRRVQVLALIWKEHLRRIPQTPVTNVLPSCVRRVLRDALPSKHARR